MCSICVPRQLFASWTSFSWKGVHPLSQVSRQPGFYHRLSCQQSSLSQSLLLVSAKRQHLREIYKLANHVWNAAARIIGAADSCLLLVCLPEIRKPQFLKSCCHSGQWWKSLEIIVEEMGQRQPCKLHRPEGSAHHSYTGIVCLFVHFDMRGHALFLGSLHISNLKSEFDMPEILCAIE